MRQDFVANVSHELRSPISSLVGIIETLQGSASKDPVSQKKFLKIMSEEAARMSRLIDDLLSLSRVEVTEHVPPDEKIKLPDIVGSAVEILRGIANKKNMTIRFEEKSELFEILGDQDELMEVFQNLIDNGIKYGDENSEIEISIVDDGPGIPTEVMESLGEPFISTRRESMGLGIFLANASITQLGGQIEMFNLKLGGAKTSIRLPMLNK